MRADKKSIMQMVSSCWRTIKSIRTTDLDRHAKDWSSMRGYFSLFLFLFHFPNKWSASNQIILMLIFSSLDKKRQRQSVSGDVNSTETAISQSTWPKNWLGLPVSLETVQSREWTGTIHFAESVLYQSQPMTVLKIVSKSLPDLGPSMVFLS